MATNSPEDPLHHTQAKFDRLREKFAAGLPTRLTEIESAATPQERAAALHRLAGAAGCFGFDALDVAARRAHAEALVIGESGGPSPELLRLLELLQEITQR